MIIQHLVSVIPLLILVGSDTLTVTITDLNTKQNKCDDFGTCNINYGEVIFINFEWYFDDVSGATEISKKEWFNSTNKQSNFIGKWNKPQVNIYDTTFIFSSKSQGGTMTFNVCPHNSAYQTSLIPCELVLDTGSYSFGTTVTARPAKKNEKTASGVVKFAMNAGTARSTSQPEFTFNLKK